MGYFSKPGELLRPWMSTNKVLELNGVNIYYNHGTSCDSEFRVEVGKGPKGTYKTRYLIVGDLPQAILLYNAINIGNGFKKRLVMNNGFVICRATS